MLGSCKKCTVADESSDTGLIIPDVVIYPGAGYMTGEMNGYYLVDGNSPFADKFQVSFDGGITKEDVDWSIYDILANPMTVDCKASFIREVNFDYVLDQVFYNVIATTCESCENPRFVENYVLIPKVPTGFTVYFDTEIRMN
ncbi:MAG: hypothetical protein A3D92_07350 [Bacteroidetes bacterium RIFCSPHIGHO2_02_FULL_44_7]|nr:MAG: hypothetical protein A3D92_07350 [Bacteroidetes bacterium RIFCSPHIGHO2_02_FULL_44_7]